MDEDPLRLEAHGDVSIVRTVPRIGADSHLPRPRLEGYIMVFRTVRVDAYVRSHVKAGGHKGGYHVAIKWRLLAFKAKGVVSGHFGGAVNGHLEALGHHDHVVRLEGDGNGLGHRCTGVATDLAHPRLLLERNPGVGVVEAIDVNFVADGEAEGVEGLDPLEVHGILFLDLPGLTGGHR